MNPATAFIFRPFGIETGVSPPVLIGQFFLDILPIVSSIENF
jgi:hypothetical protein